MGLTVGTSLPWRELCGIAEEKIILPGRLKEVCGDCEWIGICAGKDGKKEARR